MRTSERLPAVRRPAGNLPRLMALDEFGNKSALDSVNRHVSATKKLERSDDVLTDPKFEICDKVRFARAVRWVFNPENGGPSAGAPSSESINAGHKRVWGRHLGDVRAANGRMVGSRSGHRRAEVAMPRGRSRTPGPAPWEGKELWMHPHARGALVAKFERCEGRAGNTS